MPIIAPDALVGIRDSASHSSINNSLDNATDAYLQVICAWPVSSQYGVGSRFLYYVLVAACVFARKSTWLRNAVLAAALVVPAVAAIHAIVLTALHNDDAVDMDIYGAFQLCAIGVLAAPVTARMSDTYFNDPGRNTIFVWTSLLLAGLVSLTAEFFRSKPSSCPGVYATDLATFPYSNPPTCNLTCNTTSGPFSILRGGSANNLYVVPAPNVLPFGMATLMAAGCCIPPVLSLVIMWNKILDTNWRLKRGQKEPDKNEIIEGTNNATPQGMESINSRIRTFLIVVEASVFGGLVLTVLILGEINFWSAQVMYMVEPFATVGQWSPIATVALGFAGSLYMLLTAEVDTEKNSLTLPPHGPDYSGPTTPPINDGLPGASTGDTNDPEPLLAADTGNRIKIAKILKRMGELITQVPEDYNNESEFKNGPAAGYPTTPGESGRNPKLWAAKNTWKGGPENDGDGGASQASHRPTSRATSFVRSEPGIVEPPEPQASPESEDRNVATGPRLAIDDHNSAAGPSSSPDLGRPVNNRKRRDTLEVPTSPRRG